MIYTRKRNTVSNTRGTEDKAARMWVLTDEVRGLTRFALDDVGVGMANGRMC